MGDFIKDAQAIVKDYQALDPLNKIGARITDKLQQESIEIGRAHV